MINNKILVRLTVLSLLLTKLSCLTVVGNGSIIFQGVNYLEAVDINVLKNLKANFFMESQDTYVLVYPDQSLVKFQPASATLNQSLDFNKVNNYKPVQFDVAFMKNHFLSNAAGYNTSYYMYCFPGQPAHDIGLRSSGIISWTFTQCHPMDANRIYCHAAGNISLTGCPGLDENTNLAPTLDIFQNSIWVHYFQARRVLI